VRVATFNVLHGQPMTGGRPADGWPAPGVPAGIPLAEAVAALDADVLALQEVDRLQERSGLVDQAVVAAQAMGAVDWRYAAAVHGQARPGTGWDLDASVTGLRVYSESSAMADAEESGSHGIGAEAVGSHGVALLSRLPVLNWRARRLPPAPASLPLLVPGRPGLTVVSDRPRAALAAVLAGEHGPFTVVALHLSFVTGWNAGQLAAIARWIADLPRPQLVLGDFNLIGPIPRFVLSTASTGARWHDLARLPTYPAHRPLVQFDHVLASGLSSRSARAHTPQVPVSDHRPLVVDLHPR
jgi:endonuclease/exonuclease/phosphatase family metal-dependent hydrolase